MIAPGTPAPEFALATRGAAREFTQEDLKGQFTVFVFYPFAFSPVCTDQLQLYEGALGGFAERGVKLYGVSCDATWSQAAFKEKLGVSCEQLSDFEPKGATCAAMGVLHPGGFAERALVDLRRRRRRALELPGRVAGRAAGAEAAARGRRVALDGDPASA